MSGLLRALQLPGLTVQEVFQRVRRSVFDASGGKQFPAVYDGLYGEFRFREAVGAIAPVPPPPSGSTDTLRQEDMLYWGSIKDSRDPALFDEYLKRYGATATFAALARSRLAELRRPNPPGATPAVSQTLAEAGSCTHFAKSTGR